MEQDLQNRKIDNLNNILNALKTQLAKHKLSVRKKRALIASKREVVKSTHFVVQKDFQNAFGGHKALKRKYQSVNMRPFGLVPLLDSPDTKVIPPTDPDQGIKVQAEAWYRQEDGVYWVRANVRNALGEPIYEISLQGYDSHPHIQCLPRRSQVIELQAGETIDVCATYQADPEHQLQSLDDLYLVFSESANGSIHCQRVVVNHVQDIENMAWLPKHCVALVDVLQSIKVFLPHSKNLSGDADLNHILAMVNMQTRPNSFDSNYEVWVSDDYTLVVAKTKNDIQVACSDQIKLQRLVTRLRAMNTPSKTRQSLMD